MILVTGGTGFLGAHLLFKLLDDDVPVRAIYRTEKKLDIVKRIFSYYTNDIELLFNKIEWRKADLNDIPSLAEAFKDITYVYHCAAFVSFEPDKFNLLRKTNIKGTANIVNFCITNKVKKLCYVSSIAAIGTPANTNKITENTEWNTEFDNSGYAITKYGAELEVWRGTQEGVDAVIVNPGVIIGPGIWKYGSGSIIKTVHKGLKYYAKGNTAYVAVQDVVNAMITLIKSDIKNERYILIENNYNYEHFLTLTAEALKVNPPKKQVKPWQLALAWRLDWLRHKITGKRRLLSRQMAKTLVSNSNYSNAKIKDQLGFEFTPIEDAVKTTANHYLKELR